MVAIHTRSLDSQSDHPQTIPGWPWWFGSSYSRHDHGILKLLRQLYTTLPAFTTVGQNTNDTALTKTVQVRWVLLFLLLWASFHSISANAIDHLIHFLHYLFSSLSPYSAFIASLGAAFPPSYYLAKKYFALDKDRFTGFVMCLGCHSLYHFRDCYECVGSRLVPKIFPDVAFPNHPHTSR